MYHVNITCDMRHMTHDTCHATGWIEWSLCYLRLLYRGIISITHGTDVQPGLPLLVPLLEELLHDPANPHLRTTLKIRHCAGPQLTRVILSAMAVSV